MQLYQIHTQILKPFTTETVDALKTMASLQGNPGKGKIDSVQDFSFQGFAVAVVAKTFGSIEGKVLMHYTNETAIKIGKRICANVLGEEPEGDDMSEEISEAVTEFANTIIGLATKSLSQSNLRIRFTPPIFIHSPGDMEVIMDGVKQILTVPINVGEAGEFWFSYLLHNDPE